MAAEKHYPSWYAAIILLLGAIFIVQGSSDDVGSVSRQFKEGEVIYQTKSLFLLKPLLWTAPQKEVVPSYWGGSFLIYILQSLFGLYGSSLLLVFSLGSGLFLLILIYDEVIKKYSIELGWKKEHKEFSILCALVAFSLITFSSWDRQAGCLELVFVPLLIKILFPVCRGLIPAFIFTIFWRHFAPGSFLVSLLCLVFSFGSLLDKNKKRATEMLLLFFITGVSCFLYPAAIRQFISSFFVLAEGSGLPYQILKWHTPDFHQHPELVLGVGALLFFSSLCRKTFSWQLVAFYVTSTALLFFSPNFIILFGVAVSLSVFLGLQSQSFFFDLCLFRTKVFFYLSSLLAALLIVLAPYSIKKRHPIENLFPRMIKVQKELDSGNSSFNLFHDYNLSSPLVSGGFPVFIDLPPWVFEDAPLASSYTGSLFRDYEELIRVGSQWNKVLQHWKVNAALLRDDSSLASVLIGVCYWDIIGKSEKTTRFIRGREREFRYVLLKGSSATCLRGLSQNRLHRENESF